MKVFSLVIPLIFIFSFLFAAVKKVKIFDAFTDGVKGAIPLVLSVFPYLVTATLLFELLSVSGLERYLIELARPIAKSFGIPSEILPLMIVKPLSGSSSIAVISDILETYGVDSFIGRSACVAYGSAETVFYIAAVYFSSVKRKSVPVAICISLISFFTSVVFGCLLCRLF